MFLHAQAGVDVDFDTHILPQVFRIGEWSNLLHHIVLGSVHKCLPWFPERLSPMC